MTAKEYLSQAYWLDRRINSKLEQLSSLNDIATRSTSVMSDDVVSRTRNVHAMEDLKFAVDHNWYNLRLCLSRKHQKSWLEFIHHSGMARMSFREYVDRAALIHLLQSHRQPACIHLLTVHWDIWKIAEQPVNLLLIIPVPRNKGMYPIFTKQSCHIEPIHMTCVIGINNTVALFQRIFRCLFVFPRYLGRVQDTDYAIRDRKGKLRCKSL